MRVFKHPNLTNGWRCPICNTNDDKPVTLIGITGTENGNIIQAEQFHVDCLELRWEKKRGVIFAFTGEE